MAKEKISRETYDTMRSYLLKKKDAKINLDDYEVNDSKKTHSASDNEKDEKKTYNDIKEKQKNE